MIRRKFIRKKSKNPIPRLREKLILDFNQFIRLRDAGKGCISCRTGPVDHAGHFWPTSQCPQPSMRFNEKNVNGQCASCNSFNEGNRQGYEKGLRAKYGDGVILELEICKAQKQNPWTRWEYETMIKFYKTKVNELTGVI